MDDPVPGRHLLVASTGGHLAQLARWAEMLGSSPDSLWITFKSPQSDSVLHNRRAMYVPYIAPRDAGSSARAFMRMMREIDWRNEAFDAAITTGSAVGLAGLVAARLHRVPAYFFESASRVNGPSLSGRLASLYPRIHTFSQYHYADSRWQFRTSLFDSFETVSGPSNPKPRLFVTLGTIHPYRFDALVDAILATGLADDRTVWQLGSTGRRSLPGRAEAQMPATEFDECARNADIVITHSGVGTIMHLLEMGIYPVVVPRRVKRREMVDDHQTQIATLLTARGISAVCEVENLDKNIIIEATGKTIRYTREAPKGVD